MKGNGGGKEKVFSAAASYPLSVGRSQVVVDGWAAVDAVVEHLSASASLEYFPRLGPC